jgi:hypothetical protein
MVYAPLNRRSASVSPLDETRYIAHYTARERRQVGQGAGDGSRVIDPHQAQQIDPDAACRRAGRHQLGVAVPVARIEGNQLSLVIAAAIGLHVLVNQACSSGCQIVQLGDLALEQLGLVMVVLDPEQEPGAIATRNSSASAQTTPSTSGSHQQTASEATTAPSPKMNK